MKEQLVYLGVDIAKSHLDAAIGEEKRRFSNDTIGHRQLIKWVRQLSATVQVICESSGGYERGLVRALEKLDLLIKEHIEQSPGLSAKAEKLTSIKGVGLRTAALLLAQMPELGQLIVVKLQLWSA